MQTFTIYYYRHIQQAAELYHQDPPGPFSLDELDQTHVKLLDALPAHSLSSLYLQMQAEVWSPHGEARPLIEGLGLTHTSMSVGDIALHDVTGVYWLCLPTGWHNLTPDAQRQATEESNV